MKKKRNELKKLYFVLIFIIFLFFSFIIYINFKMNTIFSSLFSHGLNNFSENFAKAQHLQQHLHFIFFLGFIGLFIICLLLSILIKKTAKQELTLEELKKWEKEQEDNLFHDDDDNDPIFDPAYSHLDCNIYHTD